VYRVIASRGVKGVKRCMWQQLRRQEQLAGIQANQVVRITDQLRKRGIRAVTCPWLHSIRQAHYVTASLRVQPASVYLPDSRLLAVEQQLMQWHRLLGQVTCSTVYPSNSDVLYSRLASAYGYCSRASVYP
jgi:hypothetical protein